MTQVVEDILTGLRVHWLVVPSVKSLVGMWTRKFNFVSLSESESEALEDRIVTPDTSSATMLKKRIYMSAPLYSCMFSCCNALHAVHCICTHLVGSYSLIGKHVNDSDAFCTKRAAAVHKAATSIACHAWLAQMRAHTRSMLLHIAHTHDCQMTNSQCPYCMLSIPIA